MLTIFDRGAAAYLLVAGVPFLHIQPGSWQSYVFADDDGKATIALRTWREGSCTVNARDYWNAFKALRQASTTTTTTSEGVSTNGAQAV